ncbi:ErbB-3 bindinb protein 1 [Glycine soja]|uniref:ErbB-3 bindinb protein 1 n=2 Tax=Glycine subgen. Soja TaxID=1462606 RepID=A0A445GGI7_GLYSO|nr:ErbB-3 bindinb protein 1 [Glycine soja]
MVKKQVLKSQTVLPVLLGLQPEAALPYIGVFHFRCNFAEVIRYHIGFLFSLLPILELAENSFMVVLIIYVFFFFYPQIKDVSDAIQKVAAAYDCKIVEGVLSHQMKQFVIDGNKDVLSLSNPDTRVDEAEFEENEVYAIDIVTSTGDGKPKLLDEKQTTIYKRAVDKSYHLKMKASRFIFSEISQKFPIMPFSARALEDKRARLGLVECVNHELLQPYPVLHEKPGDFVAHIKFTVLLMPNGSD